MEGLTRPQTWYLFLVWLFALTSPLPSVAGPIVPGLLSDPALQECLDEAVVANGWTTTEEVVSLECQGRGVYELYGLENLTSLQTLRLSDNRISDVAPLDLLNQLVVLDLGNNRLTDILLLYPLQNLQELYLTGNSELTQPMVTPLLASNPGLTHLGLGGIVLDDLSQLPVFTGPDAPYALVELDVSDAGLDDLSPVAQLPTLQVLNAAGNRLMDTAPLDILPQLRELDLSDNRLTSAFLDPLSQLQVLDLRNNRLPDVTQMQGLQNLQQLYLTGNSQLTQPMVTPLLASNPGLTHLGLGGIALDDLGQLPVFTGPASPYALVELDVSDAGLDDLIPVGQLSTLQVLDAAGNRLTDTAPLDTLSQLRELDLSDNRLTSAFLDPLSQLQVLDLGNNRLPDVAQMQGLQNLQKLYLTGNSELTQPMVTPLLASNPGLTHLGLGGIALDDLTQLPVFTGPAAPYALVELDVSDAGLANLFSIEQLEALQVLRAAGNQLIDTVPLDLLQQLRVLDLSHNRLNDIQSLYPLQNLQALYLTGNSELTQPMVTPVLASNPGLTHLGLGGIVLDDLSQLPVFTGPDAPYALLELDVSDAGLDDLFPVAQLPTLQVLNAAGNRLTDTAPLDILPQLRELDLSDNVLTTAFLDPLSQLQVLDLGNNRLTDVTQLPGLENLQELYLTGNSELTQPMVTPLLASNPGLTHLGLGGIALDDLGQLPVFTGPNGPYALVELDVSDAGLDDLFPVAQLPTLQVLNAAGNRLVDTAPLDMLSQLRELDLSDNWLTTAFLDPLSQLQVLDLGNNRLSDVAQLQGLQNLRELYLTGNPALTQTMVSSLLANNPGLTHLGLGGIAIDDLGQLPVFTGPAAPYALVELDVSDAGLADLFAVAQLEALQVLRAAGNQLIDTVPLDLLQQLRVLDLSHNRLSDVQSLYPLQNLQELYLTGNPALKQPMVTPVLASNPGLTHLGLGGIVLDDLSQLPVFTGPDAPYALLELDVSDAGLDDLFPVAQLPTLQVLNAAGNRLVDTAPLDILPQLRELDLSDNVLTTAFLDPLSQLQVLDLGNNRLTDVVQLLGLQNLQALYLTGNPALTQSMVEPLLANNPGLTHLGLGGIAIVDLAQLPVFTGPAGPYALVELDITSTGITDLWPLDQLPALQVLRAADNSLVDTSSLDQLLQLRVLDLRRTGLPDVAALLDQQNLQELYLTGNTALTQAMVSPVLANNPGLTHLGLGGIAIVDLAQLPVFTASTVPYALVELDVSDAGLADLFPIEQLEALQVLRAAGNQLIDTVPLDLLQQLRVLDLGNNQLNDVQSLYPLQNLQELYLTGNPALTQPMVVPVLASNPGLTHLGLGGIAIDDLSQLPVFIGPDAPFALVELDVSDAGLDDLFPVAQLPKLQVLNAAGNRLTDTVPLDVLPQLRVLDLSDNQLQQVLPLAAIPDPEFVDLRGNTGIQCDDLDLLETQLGVGVLQRPLVCIILTAPEVLILEPLGPEDFYQTSAISFIADASDVEDGDLDSLVQWTSSLDGFLGTGSPLVQSLTTGEHFITATVTDSHGNTSTADVTIQVMPNTAPALSLWMPLNGALINSGGLVMLGAHASDVEEGDIGWKVQWSSSLDGYLGSGAFVQVQLGQASHLITATVTDNAGAGAAQSVNITVGPFEDLDEDGLSDYEETCFDGNCNDYDPYHPVDNPDGMDTDILSADTDQDGYSDVTEISLGSDPLNAASTPGVVADGDINLDGQANAADVLLAQRYLLGLTGLSQEQIDHGDYRPLPGGDGDLGVDDLILIMRGALTPG